MKPKTREAKGRLVISEEISREEAWERLTEMLGGRWRNCWLLPYVNFEPINTDSLKANIRLEAEVGTHAKYPCELTVWDVENKRFAIKIMYHPTYFIEYDFSINYFMNGATFIDARVATNDKYGFIRQLVEESPYHEVKLKQALSYIHGVLKAA
jgi:hypothetical protein